jgi:hypothetical protein
VLDFMLILAFGAGEVLYYLVAVALTHPAAMPASDMSSVLGVLVSGW